MIPFPQWSHRKAAGVLILIFPFLQRGQSISPPALKRRNLSSLLFLLSLISSCVIIALSPRQIWIILMLFYSFNYINFLTQSQFFSNGSRTWSGRRGRWWGPVMGAETQEQVPPVYNAFLISEKWEPALDGDPAPHTLRHWAEGQRETRNTQKENKKL